jgi:hypothetical protein
MNPIRNPFSRDEYPALTDAINGVVNGQPRKVEEEVTPKRMEVLNRAVQAGVKGAREGMGTPAGAQARALGNRAGLAKVRAFATKGGKKVVGFAKAKREHEAAKREHKALQNTTTESVEVVSEDHSRAALEKMSVGQLRALYKKYSAKAAKAGIPGGDLAQELANIRGLLRAKGGGVVVDEAVTPAQRKVFNAERERMMGALNNPNKKLSPTEREAVLARGQRSAAAEVRKDAVSPTGVKSPVHAQAKAYHEYARKESKKMDAIAKRKAVKESQELDERIIDEVDFFQAAKNWIKGNGFKTNREAAYARVQKNYDAMKKREAAAAKKTK